MKGEKRKDKKTEGGGKIEENPVNGGGGGLHTI